MFLCREKYRLVLRWEKVILHKDGMIKLDNATFSGPALSIAQKIGENDFIDLDLTPQHFVLFDSYYIVRLSWGKVEYRSDGSVLLQNAHLTNSYLGKLHKLEDSDYISINTEKHEEATHAYNLVYESKVMRSDCEPYEYTKLDRII